MLNVVNDDEAVEVFRFGKTRLFAVIEIVAFVLGILNSGLLILWMSCRWISRRRLS